LADAIGGGCIKNMGKRSGVAQILQAMAVVALVVLGSSVAHAQGCIIAHSTGGVGGPANQGGYLQAHHWQLDINYRHQFSFRHFVGDIEQEYRLQEGTEVENRINLENFVLTYQISPRWSADINVPLLTASRHKHDGYYTMHTAGVGDVSISVQRWMWDPQNNPSHNVQLGLGIQFPTGRDNIQNRVIVAPGLPPQEVIPDYSVQPGTGGYGIPFQWIAFQDLGSSRAQIYFNGSYLITPQEMNGVVPDHFGYAPPPNPAYTPYFSISDEYLMEAGVAYSFASVKGLSATFGPRDEGVPAHDLIGGDLGFRRPGFALSLEPGLQYYRWDDIFTVTVGRAIYRDRTRSVPDIHLGTHGDAAFADWVWLASFTHRF